jgi:hypothetical protein
MRAATRFWCCGSIPIVPSAWCPEVSSPPAGSPRLRPTASLIHDARQHIGLGHGVESRSCVSITTLLWSWTATERVNRTHLAISVEPGYFACSACQITAGLWAAGGWYVWAGKTAIRRHPLMSCSTPGPWRSRLGLSGDRPGRQSRRGVGCWSTPSSWRCCGSIGAWPLSSWPWRAPR